MSKPGLVPLRERYGSVHYMGRCPLCLRQHMSANARIGPSGECVACYSTTARTNTSRRQGAEET